MKKNSFNNERYKDRPHLIDEDTFSLSEVPLPENRIEEKPVIIDSNNYLYCDENSDRFNSIPDSYERRGQPRGISPQLGPVKEFENNFEEYNGSEMFVDDFIKASIKEDNLIEEIKNLEVYNGF